MADLRMEILSWQEGKSVELKIYNEGREVGHIYHRGMQLLRFPLEEDLLSIDWWKSESGWHKVSMNLNMDADFRLDKKLTENHTGDAVIIRGVSLFGRLPEGGQTVEKLLQEALRIPEEGLSAWQETLRKTLMKSLSLTDSLFYHIQAEPYSVHASPGGSWFVSVGKDFAGGLTGGQEIAWLTEEVLRGKARLEDVLNLVREKVETYRKEREKRLEPAEEVKLKHLRR